MMLKIIEASTVDYCPVGSASMGFQVIFFVRVPRYPRLTHVYRGGPYLSIADKLQSRNVYRGGFINLRRRPLFAGAKCPLIRMFCVLQCFGGCGCGRSEFIMGAGMHSLVSDFAVNNRNLAVVEVFIRML